jgi:hypothetical protein
MAPALLIALLVVAPLTGAAKVPAVGQATTQAKPEQPPKPKKPPSARLAEPWPDAKKMAERRVDAESRRLFQQAEPLVFTLTADFRAVNRDRDPASTKTFPAVLAIGGQEGAGATPPLHVSLRSRGNVRLQARVCSFVPLAVDFTKKEVKGTLFDGQSQLKLVTHCENNSLYDQYVAREYLVYRLYNLFTPKSFRVRLARVTYVDSTSGKALTTRNAFFIENEEDLAARAEGRPLALPRMLFKNFDQEALTLMSLFQFMIGNTDFSIYALHNVHQVQTRANVFYPIIWDFDITGLAGTPYGAPDPRLELSSPRERLYRGPCRTMAEYEPFLAVFREKQAGALALFDLPALDDRNRRDAKEYLGEFYTLLGRPEALKKELIDKCKKQSLM